MLRAWEAERAIPKDAQTQRNTRTAKYCSCFQKLSMPIFGAVIPEEKCPRILHNRNVPAPSPDVSQGMKTTTRGRPRMDKAHLSSLRQFPETRSAASEGA